MSTVDTFVPELDHERDSLRAAVDVQERLAGLALEGLGIEALVAALGDAIGGGVLVLGVPGRLVARHDPGADLGDDVVADLGRQLSVPGGARPRILAHPRLPAGAYARPLPAPGGARASAWIVVTTAGRLDERVRLVVQQGEAILGLELMHRDAVGEAERRLTAGLVADALAGRADPAELTRRLAAFGIEGDVAVAVFTAAGPGPERALQGALAAVDAPAAVSTQEVEGRALLCAIVEVGDRDPIDLATEARLALTGEVLAAVSRVRPAADLRRTFQEAHWALGVVERRGATVDAGAEPAAEVGSWRDLGIESLLLAVGDEDVLHLYCERLLGPVSAGDSIYAAELLRSLELFILHNGQWERAARELHCHRHTLRYRMRKVEELTGRDLSQATDRIEFWLALRARELLTG